MRTQVDWEPRVINQMLEYMHRESTSRRCPRRGLATGAGGR